MSTPESPEPMRPPTVLNRSLVTCFAITVFAYAGHYMLNTLLPARLLALGGNRTEAGMLFAMTTAVSMVLRPVVGGWVDRYGARPVMLSGVAVLAVTAGGFSAAHTPVQLILLMGGIGISTGLIATACAVLVARSADAARRGEALSVYYLGQSLAIAIGPPLGFALAGRGGIDGELVLIVVFSVLIAGLVLSVPVPASQTATTARSSRGFVSRHALAAGVTMVLANSGYGSMYALLPLYAAAQGMANMSWFFALYSSWLIVCRILSRRASDRLGRLPTLVPALTVIALGQFCFAPSPTVLSLAAGAVLVASGFSVLYPTLLALVVDRTPAPEQGRAVGTLSASFDLGMATGSLSVGFIADHTSYAAGFAAAGVGVLLGLGVLLATEVVRSRRGPSGSSA